MIHDTIVSFPDAFVRSYGIRYGTVLEGPIGRTR